MAKQQKKNVHHSSNASPSLTKRARYIYSFVHVYILLRLSFQSIELFTGLLVFPCAVLISNILEPVSKRLYCRCKHKTRKEVAAKKVSVSVDINKLIKRKQQKWEKKQITASPAKRSIER